MDYRLPVPHRRNAHCSAGPIVRADYFDRPSSPRPSLEELIQTFRQECSRPFHQYLSFRPLPSRQDYSLSPVDAPVGETPLFDWDSGRRYMTQAGFRVRSKAEKIIADFLTQSGLDFLYEPVLSVGAASMRPDFYLTQYALPYEHFGLNTEPYLRAAELKIARYHRAGVPFMYTTFHDEPDIDDVIVDKLAAATLDL